MQVVNINGEAGIHVSAVALLPLVSQSNKNRTRVGRLSAIPRQAAASLRKPTVHMRQRLAPPIQTFGPMPWKWKRSSKLQAKDFAYLAKHVLGELKPGAKLLQAVADSPVGQGSQLGAIIPPQEIAPTGDPSAAKQS